MKKIKYVLLIVLLLSGLLLIACSGVHEEEQTSTLTIEEAKALDEQFFEILFNPGFVDETPKVKDLETKQALVDRLSQVTTEAFAISSVNSFYEEQEDGLYIVPTEAPPEFDLNFDYTLNPVDEQQFQLIQTAENNLYGNYTLTIDYQYIDDQWKISNRILEF